MSGGRRGGERYEIAAMVHYIARIAMYMAATFFLLALAALLFMAPDPVERGIYYYVLVVNAIVIVGAVALSLLMRKSDARLAREKKARDSRNGPTIDDWLAKRAAEEDDEG
ncbi:MAG: hypothetical protein ACOYI5_07420 [Christensenellales bacterium]|jgi:hypothetical protein